MADREGQTRAVKGRGPSYARLARLGLALFVGLLHKLEHRLENGL